MSQQHAKEMICSQCTRSAAIKVKVGTSSQVLGAVFYSLAYCRAGKAVENQSIYTTDEGNRQHSSVLTRRRAGSASVFG